MKFICENLRADNIMMFELSTVQTNALFNRGGFMIRAAINWSQCCLCIPAVYDIVS